MTGATDVRASSAEETSTTSLPVHAAGRGLFRRRPTHDARKGQSANEFQYPATYGQSLARHYTRTMVMNAAHLAQGSRGAKVLVVDDDAAVLRADRARSNVYDP
jgi:hypothetical protein